jgi:maltooligosyltrehalose trehalohydrolase
MHRGALAVACNLGTEAVDVPVAGEVVLAWEQPAPGTDGTMRLNGHSVVVSRG